MKPIIQVQNVTKAYGDKVALQQLDFEVAQGEIFGMLGPSGSGKTTTVKILTAQLQPSGGRASVFGVELARMTEAERHNHLSQIGILTDNSTLYERLSIADNLELFCKLYGASKKRIDTVLEQVNLGNERNISVKKLSKGMKQRVTLARALLHEPKLLFLDEPTSALDPMNTRQIHDSLRQLNQAGTTIFLSTHDMEEAEALCDRLAFLHQGHIAALDTPQRLRLAYSNHTINVMTTDGAYQVEQNDEGAKKIYEWMSQGKLKTIHSNEPTLSDIFITLTGGTLK